MLLGGFVAYCQTSSRKMRLLRLLATKSVVSAALGQSAPSWHPVLMRLALVFLPALLVASLTGCSSGPSVDASCDVDGITHEIEHILSEAGAELGGLTSLACDSDWAYTSTQVLTGDQETTDSFLLRGTDMGWILTSPEEACSPGTPFAIPEALRETACPGA